MLRSCRCPGWRTTLEDRDLSPTKIQLTADKIGQQGKGCSWKRPEVNMMLRGKRRKWTKSIMKMILLDTGLEPSWHQHSDDLTCKVNSWHLPPNNIPGNNESN
jgi:hypothetical protein